MMVKDGGDGEPLNDDLALPVTPRAAGQPLYDCTTTMILPAKPAQDRVGGN
jgi:hypothetical protein